jgi:hypothetical protein
MKRQPTGEDYVEWLDDEQNRKFIHILGVSDLLDSCIISIKNLVSRLHLIQVSQCLCLVL